jgi:hypothetical protein
VADLERFGRDQAAVPEIALQEIACVRQGRFGELAFVAVRRRLLLVR